LTTATPEVLETDDEGNPIVVVFRESEAEREARQAERAEQAARADEVVKSLSSQAHDTVKTEDSASSGTHSSRSGGEQVGTHDSAGSSGPTPAASDSARADG
jgi:hypothetical protein